MQYLHHKPIKNFTMEGIIKDDASIGRLKIELIRLKKLEMRELGYVERFDIDPNFTINYNETKEYFEFKLTVYATYVGKSKAKWILGIDGTTAITTQKNKLEESLLDQESQSNQK